MNDNILTTGTSYPTPSTTWIPNNGGGWNPPTIPQPMFPPPVSAPGGAWYSAESMKILIDAIRASERATVLAELEELKRQHEEEVLCRERLAQARKDVELSNGQ